MTRASLSDIMRREVEENERGLRKIEVFVSALAVVFYLLCMVSLSAFGGDQVLLKPEDTNGDFLRNSAATPADASLNSQIFDKSITTEMIEKYDAFSRPYALRQTYHLDRFEDHLRYQQANQDLAEWTIKRLLQYHFENTLRNSVEEGAKRAAEESRSPGDKAAAKAVVAVSKVQRAITNSTMNLGQDTKTSFKYDFPSGMMRVGMKSPVLDASMNYRMKAPNPVVGSVAQSEKLSVGVSRGFSDLKASTNANYALANDAVNYGVNKHVVGPLSAQVDQVHQLRDTSKDETVYRLNVGLGF